VGEDARSDEADAMNTPSFQKGCVFEAGGAFYVKYSVQRQGTRIQHSKRLCSKDAEHPTKDSATVIALRDQFMRIVSSADKGGTRKSHGANNTPEWRAYHDAKARCNNPRHKRFTDYGGRGIRFLFTSFDQFIANLGLRPEGLTLDRINNDGHYEPGNVRWATDEQQIKNRRTRKPQTSGGSRKTLDRLIAVARELGLAA
jgi:hypothetical protein